MALVFEGFHGKIVQCGNEAYEECVYQYAWSSLIDEGIIEPEAILYAQDDADVTLGISVDLGTFQKKLGEQGWFLPMGVCRQVHLGGHVQTGGYGQFTRSFGLLADYVQKVRIIIADYQVRWAKRGRIKDKDLFYAILDGSPGNFGVLMDVILNVLKDDDHPESLGFRAPFPYSEATIKRLLDVMVDQDGMPDTPGDYDYCLSMMSASPAEGRPVVIVAFAHWANLEGHDQPHNSGFFEKILDAGGADKAMSYLGIFLDGKTHTPMSVLCSHWILYVTRVFPFPFHKHTHFSNSNSKALKAKDWTRWFQYCGGIHSRFLHNAKDGAISFSGRDSHFMSVLAAAYDVSASKDDEKIAKAWVHKNDSEGVGHPKAKFSTQDRRVLWGSYDLDLPAARKYYFDQEPEKYNRLSGIKKMFDPSHVFTPNKFCIGPLPTHVLQCLEKLIQ
ncbi:MAG: hypothetical protein J3R72DRAFT_512968 [Linnemannia gamsii]|nr:MAG: hypothetical protein J3R72DRAFT_512968 [Linnemannia gamsii]